MYFQKSNEYFDGANLVLVFRFFFQSQLGRLKSPSISSVAYFFFI